MRHYPVSTEHTIDVTVKDDVPILEFNGDISFEQAVEALYKLSKIQESSKKSCLILGMHNLKFKYRRVSYTLFL